MSTTKKSTTEQPYIPLNKSLLSAKKVIVPSTNEAVKLNLTQKIVLTYIFDRFEFFKSNGQEYFDNQRDIAAATGLSKTTVNVAISYLVKVKLIDVSTRQIRGSLNSNCYTSIADPSKLIDADSSDSFTEVQESVDNGSKSHKSHENRAEENKPQEEHKDTTDYEATEMAIQEKPQLYDDDDVGEEGLSVEPPGSDKDVQQAPKIHIATSVGPNIDDFLGDLADFGDLDEATSHYDGWECDSYGCSVGGLS